MSWMKELAREIKQSKDGDTIFVLNKTRVELAQRAARRMGKDLIFKSVIRINVANRSPRR